MKKNKHSIKKRKTFCFKKIRIKVHKYIRLLPEKDTLRAMSNVPVQCNKYFKTNSFRKEKKKKGKKNQHSHGGKAAGV